MAVIGIDVGYGMTKVYGGEVKGEAIAVVFPSVYKETTDGFSVDNNKNKAYKHITINGKSYYVGKFAVAKNGISQFNKADMLRHQLCILTGIASTLGEYSGQVALGLPISDMGSLKADLEALKGKYEVVYNGTDMEINITKVHVFAQGGTVIEELATYDEDTELSTIGIVDIGQKTVDVAWYNDAIIADEKTRSWDDLGCNFVYQEVIKEVYDKLGYQIPDTQIAEQIKRKPKVAEIAEPFFKAFAERIEEKLRLSGWNYNALDRLVLVGGGSHYVAEYLKKSIDCVELHENAAFANACGFYYKAGGK